MNREGKDILRVRNRMNSEDGNPHRGRDGKYSILAASRKGRNLEVFIH